MKKITGVTNFPKYVEIKECSKCGSKDLFIVASLCSVYYDVKNGRILQSNVFIDTCSSFDYDNGTSLHCRACNHSQYIKDDQVKEEK